jgi:hypothetical protein
MARSTPLRLVPAPDHYWRRSNDYNAKMAILLRAVSEAQDHVDECWDRLYMSSDSGEPDDGAVLDYEMALNDLIEAKAKSGL